MAYDPAIVLAGWSSQRIGKLDPYKSLHTTVGAALFLTAPAGDNPECLMSDWCCSPSTVWNTSQQLKTCNSWHTTDPDESPGRCRGKKANPQQLHSVWSCSRSWNGKTSEKGTRAVSGWWGSRRGWGGRTEGMRLYEGSDAAGMSWVWTPSRSPFLLSPGTGAVPAGTTGGTWRSEHASLRSFLQPPG